LHSILEFELRRVENFPTTTEARRGVAAWIDDYNRDRRHSSIGMICPIAYERSLDPEAAA
jgi:putative transposase